LKTIDFSLFADFIFTDTRFLEPDIPGLNFGWIDWIEPCYLQIPGIPVMNMVGSDLQVMIPECQAGTENKNRASSEN